MRPKLQQIGYLPVLKMHLNRLVKSLLWFLELHLIYHQYLELIVCLQFVECRIELFIFNLIVKWTSDHFDSGFERFSHQSLAFVYYSENSRSRLFKVIIKLLCAHCFSSLGTLYFFFLRVKKSFLSVSRCILGSGSSIFETPFLMNSSAYKVAPFFLLTIFLIHLRFLVQRFNGLMVPWFHGHLWLQRCAVSGSLSCRACFSLRSNPPFSFALI